MSDLLSSASLLLTLTGLLYSVWYPEIRSAIDLKVKNHAADRVQDLRNVRNIRNSKLWPLTISSIALTGIFGPDSIRIIFGSIQRCRESGRGAFRSYDAVQASMILVVLGAILLSIHLITMCFKVRDVVRKLK